MGRQSIKWQAGSPSGAVQMVRPEGLPTSMENSREGDLSLEDLAILSSFGLDRHSHKVEAWGREDTWIARAHVRELSQSSQWSEERREQANIAKGHWTQCFEPSPWCPLTLVLDDVFGFYIVRGQMLARATPPPSLPKDFFALWQRTGNAGEEQHMRESHKARDDSCEQTPTNPWRAGWSVVPPRISTQRLAVVHYQCAASPTYATHCQPWSICRLDPGHAGPAKGIGRQRNTRALMGSSCANPANLTWPPKGFPGARMLSFEIGAFSASDPGETRRSRTRKKKKKKSKSQPWAQVEDRWTLRGAWALSVIMRTLTVPWVSKTALKTRNIDTSVRGRSRQKTRTWQWHLGKGEGVRWMAVPRMIPRAMNSAVFYMGVHQFYPNTNQASQIMNGEKVKKRWR